MLRVFAALAIVVEGFTPNVGALPARADCELGERPSCPPPTDGDGYCEILCIEDPLFIASWFVRETANITNALLDQYLRIILLASDGRLRCDGDVQADLDPLTATADAGCDRIILVPATDVHGTGPLGCRILATGDAWVNTSTWSSSDPRTWADDLNPATPIWVDPCVL